MARPALCVSAVFAFLAVPSGAIAQTKTSVQSTGERELPWTVVIRPSAKSVAIGNCQAVYIDLTDETGKDIPRQPGGFRVSISDFDWTATAEQPSATVGLYNGPSSWSVCACPGATVGSPITITATYPAKSLRAKDHVPGIAFRSYTTLPVAPATGRSIPKGCDDPETLAVAASPVVTPTGAMLTPSIATVPGSTLPPTVRPVATPPVAPGPPPPSGIATPPPCTAAPSGPPPASVTVGGNSAEAVVKWAAPLYTAVQPTGYLVDRTSNANPTVGHAQSPMLTTLEWRDPLMSSGDWVYRVTAVYADCRRGSSASGWKYPEPQTPKNLRGEQLGRDSVALVWDAVPGASYYSVTGPPNSRTLRADVAHLAAAGVPLGAGTWQVTPVYEGIGGAGTPSRTGGAASVSVTMVQRHYRLIAEALRVNAETVDQQFSGDGKYDEVFVMGVGERINRSSGAQIDVSRAQVSAVHGDVSSWPPPQRVKAGTASGNGGIQHGDMVTPIWSAPTPASPMGAPTFVLWEGELIGGTQDLLLHPMIVEVDEPDSHGTREIPASYAICPGLPCTWSRYFTGPGQSSRSLSTVKAAIAAPQISVKDGVKMWLSGSGYFVHLENQNRDRPIGLEVESDAEKLVGLVGMWRDKVVVLSREKIEAALASGQSRIEVRFWEHWNLTNTPQTTVNYLNGDYTLVIRIERSPQATIQ